MIAYHFVGATLRDGRPIPADGEWLEHDGPLEMCASGLHASLHPYDALKYAPGNTLCLVECEGDVEHQDGKLVCRRRKIIARIDAEPLLREYARWCALQVVELWDAPEVVRQYLTTGSESLRAAAWAAARAAAGDAAWAAAWAAARDAAWATAWATATAAAWAAAGATATATAWAAAWDAQKDHLQKLVDAAFAAGGEK